MPTVLQKTLILMIPLLKKTVRFVGGIFPGRAESLILFALSADIKLVEKTLKKLVNLVLTVCIILTF